MIPKKTLANTKVLDKRFTTLNYRTSFNTISFEIRRPNKNIYKRIEIIVLEYLTTLQKVLQLIRKNKSSEYRTDIY